MEKVRREKMQLREKVGKSEHPVVFQCFVSPEGRKVGSLKRRVRSQLARVGPFLKVEMLKKCAPLWQEARFQVKMCKTLYVRTTFGRLHVEKSARRCGAKHMRK